jgi:hypothetical protein
MHTQLVLVQQGAGARQIRFMFNIAIYPFRFRVPSKFITLHMYFVQDQGCQFLPLPILNRLNHVHTSRSLRLTPTIHSSLRPNAR